VADVGLLTGRLDRLRGLLADLGVSSFLVTNSVNTRYLTGFQSSNAALLVGAERALLLTDGRYAGAARSVPDVEVVQAGRDLPRDLRERLPVLTSGPVAFEAAAVSYATHATLSESGVQLVATQKVVERLRSVKDAAELDAVRRAAAILTETLELLARERVVGKTEREVAWWVERTMRELGAEAVSFDPIVASGPNSALPHHHPGERELEPDEIVLVDAGCRVEGYCSDCTRTFSTGRLSRELERAFAVCLEAQAASLEALVAGAACRDVDQVQRVRLAEHGYSVLHGLGHAVGLEIHEEPRLTDTSDDRVEAGNVLTVEPGVYLPGVGGIRIEDLVIVGEDDLEILTPVTKALVTLA
jgi:Xaa-Pro aminopeptidase